VNRQTLAQRRALSRAERKASAEQARYARSRSQLALVRMRDAVTKALAAAVRAGRETAAG
jgi:hypothetical protein